MAKKPGQGKLRIGNQWNAIRIIALSQSNPLKAVAEFVENSIDAGAGNITIIRGRKQGEHYLRITDDGSGVADFAYVATHIGDSIKRRLKRQGHEGIQGEFGIGLLSFWTVGQELTMTSRDSEGVVKRMTLVRDSPAYAIRESRELFDRPGTTLHVQPILPGVRVLSGEKIQSYLASELRDRITRTGVKITILDRSARKELTVVPRKYQGSLVHGLPALRSALGEVYVELYMCQPAECGGIGLYKSGTRVLEDLRRLEGLNHAPWTSGYLEGIIDADFLNLTPGTRTGIVYDEGSEEVVRVLQTLEDTLAERISEQQRAEEEEASKSMLRRITRALREAFSMLPEEQYGWLAATMNRGKRRHDGSGTGADQAGGSPSAPGTAADAGQVAVGDIVPSRSDAAAARRPPEFFELAGPLYKVGIRPAKAVIAVSGGQRLSAVARDRSGRTIIDGDVRFDWEKETGEGKLVPEGGEFAVYHAPDEPEVARISLRAIQTGPDGTDVEASAESIITVTAEMLAQAATERATGKGLPGYTFEYLPGNLWRSRYDESRALITINSGHADFIHASRQPRSKLRYVARLFAKEIVLSNFPGDAPADLLERLVELTLYMDENLR